MGDWFQANVLPKVMWFVNTKAIRAIKDGMVYSMPLIIVGAVFLLLFQLPVEALANAVNASGMVPYLSESLEERDNRKITRQINQILDTSIYILVPMIMVFIFFARDIYFIMYGNRNLDLGAKLFAVSNIQIFLGTIAPIFSSIMMSLKLRKDAIITLIISFIVKFITFFPLVGAFGAYGMIYSSGLYYVIQIVMYFMALRKNFGINVKGATRRFIKTLIASLIMVIPAFALRSIIPFQFDSRIIDIAIMGVLGLIMVSIYYVITVRMGLPQKIFGIKDISLRKLIARFRV